MTTTTAIMTALDRHGNWAAVIIQPTATTQGDGDVVRIDGDLFVVREVEA